jgi:hypothetical protein
MARTTKHDAIWDACREAQESEASRLAQRAARLKAAALAIDFEANEGSEWAAQCPECGRRVQLFIDKNGEIRAGSTGGELCHAIPAIQRRLRDEGFQS